MSEFINTVDKIGDDELSDQLISRTVTEYRDNRISKIGGHAFYSCRSLQTLDIPNVTEIHDSAFDTCSGLTEVKIPLVRTIISNGFRRCSGLKSLDTPELKELNGGYIFDGCSNLTALILRSSTVCVLASNQAVFYGTPIASGTGYIYVPDALVKTYQAATNWSAYAAQFRALEDYTVDGTITGALDETKTGG